MDKGNGQLLQSYKGHINTDYRIRSCLGLADSVVVSGSEDGSLYAWDVLEGKVVEKIEGAHGGKVASAVAWNSNRGRKEWASASTEGAFSSCGAEVRLLITRDRYGEHLGNSLVNCNCTINDVKAIARLSSAGSRS